MKKLLVCLLLLFGGASQAVLYAQGKAASTLIKTGLRGGSRNAAVTVGNVTLKLPPAVMKQHVEDINNLHVIFELNPAVYKRIAAANNAYIVKSIQHFMRDFTRFNDNTLQIASNIQSQVFTEGIPYRQYLPKDLDMLFIGEVHEIPGLAREVQALIRSLSGRYPGRRIYLATEFLPADESGPFSIKMAVTKPWKISRLLRYARRMSTPVLYEALRMGIPVVGLEEERALFKKVWQETKQFPSQESFEDYAVSFVGMDFRNKSWAKRLRALRQADPDALIVVYAGYGHVAYHRQSNLPGKLREKSFVISYTVPEFLPLNNPLFRYFRESRGICQQFHASPKAKLVASWKKDTPLKKIMGADMAVILQSK